MPFSLDVLQANIGALETSGIDLNARYGWDVGFGGLGDASGSRFDISTAWTHTKEFTVTPMQAVPQNKNECVGAYGSTCGEPIPEDKGVTRFTWTTGPLGISLRHRFIGAVTTDRYVLAKRNAERAGNAAGVDAANAALATYTNPKFSAKNYLDLSVSYDFGESTEVHAGVNNILDTDPPIVAGVRRLRQHVPGDLRLRRHDRVRGSHRQVVLKRVPPRKRRLLPPQGGGGPVFFRSAGRGCRARPCSRHWRQ